MFYYQKIKVPIGGKGYYFWDNKFTQKLDPGFYIKSGIGTYKGDIILHPDTIQSIQVANQQVLTSDGITLRISILSDYKIVDGEKFVTRFIPVYGNDVTYYGEEYIRNELQVFLRAYISNFESLEISEDQNVLRDIDLKSINEKLAQVGVEVESFLVKDIGFPKKIQELFAKRLESQISAKTDLENARTVVATTRALKNASKMISEDENIKFLQYLETISKVSQKGNHSFHFGDLTSK